MTMKRIIGICFVLLMCAGQLQAADSKALKAKTNRAYKLLEVGDVDQAKKLFVDVIQSKGGDDDALQGLATCLYIKGDYRRAKRTLNIVLQRDKLSAYAHALMGGIYFNENQLSQAKKELSQAVSIDPKRASYQSNLGVILREMGDDAAAKQAFEKALKANSRHPEANFNMAVLMASGPEANIRQSKKYYRAAKKAGYPADSDLDALLK